MAVELTQEQKDAGWQVVRLGDVARIVTGSTPKKSSPEHWGNSIPFLTPSDQNGGVRTPRTERFLSEEGKEAFSKRIVPPLAIALTCIGATIGKISLVQVPTVTNQQINSLIALEGTNPRYLYYTLSTYREELLNVASGSATPIVSKGLLKKMEVSLPPLPEQNRIAEILGSLDDKIEANSRLIENLDTFGSTLTLNSLNRATETITLSDIANITMGQSPPGSSLNEEGKGVVFYQGRRDFGFRYPTARVYTTEPSRMAKAGDILLSVRAPVGDLNRASEDCCIGRGVAAIQGKEGTISTDQLFYLLGNISNFWNTFTGEGTVFSSINRKQIHTLPLRIVPQSSDFADIELAIKNLALENVSLAETRDSLIRHLIG